MHAKLTTVLQFPYCNSSPLNVLGTSKTESGLDIWVSRMLSRDHVESQDSISTAVYKANLSMQPLNIFGRIHKEQCGSLASKAGKLEHTCI